MSLEEKMELFQRSKTQDLNSFLGTLTRNQREALWKKFERARGSTKDPKVEEVWNTVCKGKNSDQHKKQLLKVFLQTKGELKNSQAWQKEVLSLQQTSGHRSSLEWVPFATILHRYGLQVKKGTILVQKDPLDDDEWQFALAKNVDYSATEQRHEVAAEQVGKMEVCNWMKVKAKGFLGNEEGSADQALRDVMPQKASKHMKALLPPPPSDSESSEHAASSSKRQKKDAEASKGKDKQVIEAEVLSDMGSSAVAGELKKRVEKMLKLLQAVKKEVGTSKVKDHLHGPETDLKKLLKTKMNAESAKGKLFDAAMAIKTAKKL
ncbi:unnamed protein product [Durusdinium trenchii]|uniref:Uncharacterized protein n=1 Tax=Durusdinium trenchii TaxID=1381693 RepID=A0ABP0L592_9DINO